MFGSSFESLLTGTLSSEVVWERSHRCPCITSDGSPNRKCKVCGGEGAFWDEASDRFRLGLVSLTSKALAAIQQRFGPGVIGDATMSIPFSALCWADVGERDRFLEVSILDRTEWTITPGTTIRIPTGAQDVSAKVISMDGTSVVAVDPPVPDAKGRVSVAVTTVISFRSPRRYEVVKDLIQARSFGDGRLPKKLLVKLIDWTAR